MKTFITAALFVMTLSAAPSFAATTKTESVHVLSTKEYMFYFKVEKNLVGGVAEVFDAENNLVATEKIERSKNIVDFFYLPSGTYTVKIKKGNEEFSFTYQNKE